MSLGSRLSSLLRTVARSPAARRAARDLTRAAVQTVQEKRNGGGRSRSSEPHGPDETSGSGREAGSTPARERGSVPGPGGTADLALEDRRGASPVAITYEPRPDDHPDPGEVVWAWVPYEEDLSRGKDRPVLVLAEEDARAGGQDGHGEVLVALMLTSRDRARADAVHVDEHGATWVDVGSGPWDRKGRPSEVRIDRLLRLDPGAVRREGARLDQERFGRVAQAVRHVHGWDG